MIMLVKKGICKKVIAGLVALLMIVLIPDLSNLFTAQAATLDAVNSVITADGLITWWNGGDTDITIPVEINGVTVKGIGDRVFMGKGIQSVTFESGVSLNAIGKQAFQNNDLTALTLPPSLRSIGEAAFAFNKISTLELNPGLTALGKNAFRDNALTALTLPQALRAISEGAFMLNPELSSVNLQDVTKIENEAFFGCNFDEVILPAGLTEYGANVFAHNRRYVLVSGNALAVTYSSTGQFGEITGNIRTLTVKYQDENGNDLLSPKVYTSSRTVQADSTADLVVDGNLLNLPVPSISGWRAIGGDPDMRYIAIDGDKTYTVVYAPDNKAPVFSGLNDLFIPVGGAAPDLLDGVTAVSGKGEDITANIKIFYPSGWFSSSSERSYVVTYSVTDPDDAALFRTEYRSVLVGSNPMVMEVGFGWLYEDFLYSPDGKTLLGLSPAGVTKFNMGNTTLMLPGKCPVAANGDAFVPLEEIADGTETEPLFEQDFAYISFTKMTALKYIGDFAFSAGVEEVSNRRTIPSGSTGMTLTGLFNCDKLVSIGAFAFAKMKLSDLDLGGCSALETIGESAFEMSSMSTLNLSGCYNLLSFGDSAFRNALLTALDLRECTRLELIGEFAFSSSPLTELDLSKNTELREIMAAAFNVAPVTSLDFSNNLKLKIIGAAAFSGSKLADLATGTMEFTRRGLILSPALEEIRSNAFSSANYSYYNPEAGYILEYVDFSMCSSLRYIGSYAFGFYMWYFNYVSDEVYPLDLSACVSLEIIDDNAFYYAYPSEVILSGCVNLKYIGHRAFGYFWEPEADTLDLSGCVNLEFIGDSVFTDIPLSGLDLRANTKLKEIGMFTFNQFVNNGKAYLPDSIEKISQYTFGNNNGSSPRKNVWVYTPSGTSTLTDMRINSATGFETNVFINKYGYYLDQTDTDGNKLTGGSPLTGSPVTNGNPAYISPPAITGYTAPASQLVAFDGSNSQTVSFEYTRITAFPDLDPAVTVSIGPVTQKSLYSATKTINVTFDLSGDNNKLPEGSMIVIPLTDPFINLSTVYTGPPESGSVMTDMLVEGNEIRIIMRETLGGDHIDIPITFNYYTDGSVPFDWSTLLNAYIVSSEGGKTVAVSPDTAEIINYFNKGIVRVLAGGYGTFLNPHQYSWRRSIRLRSHYPPYLYVDG